MFTYYSGYKALLPRKILNENSYINKQLINVGVVLGTLLDISCGHLLGPVGPSRTPLFFQLLTLAVVQLWCAQDLCPSPSPLYVAQWYGRRRPESENLVPMPALLFSCCVTLGNQISPLSLIYKMGKKQYSPRLVVKVNQCHLLGEKKHSTLQTVGLCETVSSVRPDWWFSLSLFFLVCIISHTMIRNHRRIIQRAFKEYQGLGSTPRYSYLIGFGWSPGIGILKSSQVILMCQPRLRSTFGS